MTVLTRDMLDGAVGAGIATAEQADRLAAHFGASGDLGGLEGADRHCQQLAAGAGDRNWRAFLSTGCDPEHVKSTGGDALFCCFAVK